MKQFEKPDFKIVYYNGFDVICTSGGLNDGNNFISDPDGASANSEGGF